MGSRRTRVKQHLDTFDERGCFEILPDDFGGPAAWSTVFGREAPIEIEIGFGKGEFLVARADMCPERNFVGFEIDTGRLRWAEYKVFKAGLTNVRFVAGDATRLLPTVFAPGQVAAAYMNFPDPWPKARHAKRRMIRADVVATMVDIVAPGGDIIIVTDVTEYARVGLELLEAQAHAVVNACGPGVIAPALDGYPETIHEWKFRRQGRTINFLHFRRLPAPSED